MTICWRLQNALVAATSCKTAEDFKTAFDTINKGAAQTAEGLADRQNAFAAYAKAAIAAAQNIDQAHADQKRSELESQAASLGLADALDKAGIAGKKAGEDTAQGFDKAKASIAGAGDAAQGLAGDVSAAAIAADRIGESAKTSAAAFGAGFGGVIAVTEASSRALTEMNDILGRGGTLATVWLDQAKFLLKNLGALAGAQAQVLTQRIAELEAVAQRTEETASRMRDEAASIQDQIDQLNGNESDIEDRRHAKKLADIKTEADASGTSNTAEYRKLVDLESQLHDLKLSNLQKQKQQSADQGSAPAVGGTNINVPLGAGKANSKSTGVSINNTDLANLTPTQIRALAAALSGDSVAAETILTGVVRGLQRSRAVSGFSTR